MSIEIERAKYEKVWECEDYRKFSPGLRAIKDFKLLDIIKKDRIKSVLDVGCGSGKAMQYLLTQMPELKVHGFDIASNCLDSHLSSELLTTGCVWSDVLPQGYDTVVACDIFEHLPEEHVEASLLNIFKCTRVSAFFCIALFKDKFGLQLLGTPLHLSLFRPENWIAKISSVGFTVANFSVISNSTGTPLWLYAYCDKGEVQ